MRTVAKTLLSAAAIAAVTVSSAWADIPWQSNLKAAHAQAEANGKPLLLHFYIDNCGPCMRLESGAFKSPQVTQAIGTRFVPVKIHGGKNPKLTEMFKVTEYPMDVIVTPSGKQLVHSASPQDPARYVAMLSTALQATGGGARPVAPANGTVTQNVNQQNAVPSAMSQSAMLQSNQFAPNPQPSMPNAAAASGGSMMPSSAGMPGGASVQLSSSRQASLNSPAMAPAARSQESDPELAMQGFCPVTVIKEDRWVEGNPKFGVIHLGKLYLFSDAGAMQTFLADPVPYTPVLNEIDVVRFFEERKIVQGKREWGLKDPTHNRMFFFHDEAAMNHFWNEYERYTGAAIEVMEKAVRDSNPGT